MSKRVGRLPSKIVQYDDVNAIALCDDGSIWEYFRQTKIWAQIHPPHEPPTHAADLAEALKMLRKVLNISDIKKDHTRHESISAFAEAYDLLRKHGVPTK
jgi:hypothetical protein